MPICPFTNPGQLIGSNVSLTGSSDGLDEGNSDGHEEPEGDSAETDDGVSEGHEEPEGFCD